jgi:hypothetical protein
MGGDDKPWLTGLIGGFTGELRLRRDPIRR